MTDWNSAYLEHGPSVLAYLRRRVDRSELAEDLYQETFARAIQAPSGLRDPSRVRSYLFQTAHNLLVNHLRRPRDLIRSASDLGDAVVLEEVADPRATSPEDGVRAREIREALEAAVERLSDDQQTVFRLALLRRRRYADIADELGWTVAKVKITVFRTRRALMRQLPEHLSSAEREGNGQL